MARGAVPEKGHGEVCRKNSSEMRCIRQGWANPETTFSCRETVCPKSWTLPGAGAASKPPRFTRTRGIWRTRPLRGRPQIRDLQDDRQHRFGPDPPGALRNGGFGDGRIRIQPRMTQPAAYDIFDGNPCTEPQAAWRFSGLAQAARGNVRLAQPHVSQGPPPCASTRGSASRVARKPRGS